MSSDAVRELNAAVERHDIGSLVGRCHADVIWEHNPGGGSPEEGTYHGREEIRQLFERILEGWDYMRPEPSEVAETETGVYRIRGELRCKHSSTESEIVERYEQRLEFHEGLLSKGRMVIGA
jgi:ketosteroid isomerase-like protein